MAWPLISSGRADHRGLGDGFVRHQRRLYFHGAEAVAGDVDHVVHPAHDPEVAVFVFARAVAGEVGRRGICDQYCFT